MTPAAPRPALLEVRGLTRRFGGLTAVSDLSFEVRAGEILGLIGPNGAGKSSTFNVVSGFLAPTAGRMIFDGEDITGLGPERISRRGLVRTFQHGSLWPQMSVYDNLRVATLSVFRRGAERDRRVRETAGLLGLEGDLDALAGQLPHGRQRLVSMAIAFARRPRLLCLDEPLTGLNQSEVGGVLAVFRRMRDGFGTTILLVEHNMKAVMAVCERIVVLDHGVLLAEGRPDDVARDPAVIEAYLGRRA